MPILAKAKISSLYVFTGQFESYLVANSQEIFSRDVAHLYYCHSVQIIGCHGNGTILWLILGNIDLNSDKHESLINQR